MLSACNQVIFAKDWNLLSEDSGISARLMGFKDHAKQAKYEFGGPFSMMWLHNVDTNVLASTLKALILLPVNLPYSRFWIFWSVI